MLHIPDGWERNIVPLPQTYVTLGSLPQTYVGLGSPPSGICNNTFPSLRHM
jgi:hypothetical protein